MWGHLQFMYKSQKKVQQKQKLFLYLQLKN